VRWPARTATHLACAETSQASCCSPAFLILQLGLGPSLLAATVSQLFWPSCAAHTRPHCCTQDGIARGLGTQHTAQHKPQSCSLGSRVTHQAPKVTGWQCPAQLKRLQFKRAAGWRDASVHEVGPLWQLGSFTGVRLVTRNTPLAVTAGDGGATAAAAESVAVGGCVACETSSIESQQHRQLAAATRGIAVVTTCGLVRTRSPPTAAAEDGSDSLNAVMMMNIPLLLVSCLETDQQQQQASPPPAVVRQPPQPNGVAASHSFNSSRRGIYLQPDCLSPALQHIQPRAEESSQT
jgi:hypothetical protein